MSYKLSQICEAIGVDFVGDDCEIVGIHTLSEATSNQLSFFNSEKYLNQLSTTKAKAVLIEQKYASLLPASTYPIVTNEPYLKLALASKMFAPHLSTKSENHKIGKGCDIDRSVVFGSNIS
ncbi:MAG TPA: UDP-3-O-(3-hydroxymyristoyl)glucosamine N-acyltransferase, partial [Epsilonproteobacteria bacterium]|nr:UDP-3-O-(3-hydroxymyristoyl)glucosamine N-acyltransferase [Campylobacterota bacterium]